MKTKRKQQIIKRNITMDGGKRYRGALHECPNPPDRTTPNVDCYCKKGYRWCPHAKQCTKIIYRATKEEEKKVPCKPGYWRCSDQVCYQLPNASEEDNKAFTETLKQKLDDTEPYTDAFENLSRRLDSLKPNHYFTYSEDTKSSSPTNRRISCKELSMKTGFQLNRQTKELKYDNIYISLKKILKLLCEIYDETFLLYKSINSNSNSQKEVAFQKRHNTILDNAFKTYFDELKVFQGEIEKLNRKVNEKREQALEIHHGTKFRVNNALADEIQEKIQEIREMNPDENNTSTIVEQLPKILELNDLESSDGELLNIRRELGDINQKLNKIIIDQITPKLTKLNNIKGNKRNIDKLNKHINDFIERLTNQTDTYLSPPFKASIDSIMNDYKKIQLEDSLRKAEHTITTKNKKAERKQTTKKKQAERSESEIRQPSKTQEEIILDNIQLELFLKNTHYNSEQKKFVSREKHKLNLGPGVVRAEAVVAINQIIKTVLIQTVAEFQNTIENTLGLKDLPEDDYRVLNEIKQKANKLKTRIHALKPDKMESIELILKELKDLEDPF